MTANGQAAREATQFRPRDLASYNAWSAASSTASTASSDPTEQPTLTVTANERVSLITNADAPMAARNCSPRRSTCYIGRLRCEHDELFPTPSHERVVVTDRAAEATGEDAEHDIADRMALLVVHLLEVVGVDHEHSYANISSSPTRELNGARLESPPVAEPGERVGVAERAGSTNFLLELILVRPAA